MNSIDTALAADRDETLSAGQRVRLTTLGRFLIGDRDAILRIASSRHAIWIALLFVLSAGLAREYDQEYLIASPGYVLIPLAVSTLAAALLFCVVRVATWRMRAPLHFCRMFLTLFWMTAPLAWLYAVPYERMTTPFNAVVLNLLTLGVVSVWRVLLITRVAAVLTGLRFWQAMFHVLLFADVAAAFASLQTQLSLISIMGGIDPSAEERLIIDWFGVLGNAAIVSLPVWFIGTAVLATRGKPQWTGPDEASTASGPSRGVVTLAAVSVLGWLAVLPFTQPEQHRRFVAERLLATDAPAALRYMSTHDPQAFPPAWRPWPRRAIWFVHDRWADVLHAIADEPPAPWVRRMCFTEFVAVAAALDPHRAATYTGSISEAINRLPDLRVMLEAERDRHAPDTSAFRSLDTLLNHENSAVGESGGAASESASP